MPGLNEKQAAQLLDALERMQNLVEERTAQEVRLAEGSLKMASLEAQVDKLNVTVIEGNGKPSLKALVDANARAIMELGKDIETGKTNRTLIYVAIISGLASLGVAVITVMHWKL